MRALKPSFRIRLFFFLLLAASAVLRILLALYSRTAYIYNDELLYLKMAEGLWLRQSFAVWSSPAAFSKILYPVLLSPFYAIGDAAARVTAISVFNALLLSSALIPGYLLACRFLKKESHLVAALLLLAAAPDLFFSVTFMAENCYIPLLLWSFYLVFRFRDHLSASVPKALLLGFCCFLLYLTKEVGIAFLLALLALLLRAAFAARFARASLRPLPWVLAGFLLPWLLVRFLVFGGAGYSYAHQATFANLTTISQLLFLFYALGKMLVYFLVSRLAFPVLLPLSSREADPARKSLRFLASVYVLAVALGIAFGISLDIDALRAMPSIHLRYFAAAGFPFLLLFLSTAGAEEAENLQGRKALRPLLILGLVTVAAIFLFAGVPVTYSTVDSPALQVKNLLLSFPTAPLWMKLVPAGILAACLLLWALKKRSAALWTALSLLLALEIASAVPFVSQVRRESAADQEKIREASLLNDFLSAQEGNILLVAPEKGAEATRLMDTCVTREYAFLTTPGLLSACADPSQASPIALSGASFPNPLEGFAAAETYSPEKVDLLVLGDPSLSVLRSAAEDITPPGVSFVRVYRSYDPSVLGVTKPRDYTLGDEIIFFGEEYNAAPYVVSGFYPPEKDFCYTEGTQAVLAIDPHLDSATDLRFTWTWAGTIGAQSCSVYVDDALLYETDALSAPDNTVSFYLPADFYLSSEPIRLTFNFPDACHASEIDPRILAVAFRTLRVVEAGDVFW